MDDCLFLYRQARNLDIINEINGALGHLCARVGTPEDCEMNEMALPSRHTFRNWALTV